MFLNLMKKYEELFDGTLGEWKGEPYHIELREGVKLYHGRPYQIPKAYEQMLKCKLKRLCQICILKKVNCSE